jgi:hypothetical protein
LLDGADVLAVKSEKAVRGMDLSQSGRPSRAGTGFGSRWAIAGSQRKRSSFGA